MAESDADLIRRWRGGDVSAFEAVVRRWEPPLARFLSRLAASDQVPDLMQETLLRVYRAGPGYRENGHFSTWLFQIALNVARDAARRRRPATPLADETPLSPKRGGDERELGHLIARALAELPAPMREVVALRHDRDMSFEDMSRLLGVPASTLKSRFAAALTRLRQRLQEWGYGPEDPP
jgi:RNA polymerase sigma-70 factor (ECF subfamily)